MSSAYQPGSAVTSGAEGRGGLLVWILRLLGSRTSRRKPRRQNGVGSSKISPLEGNQHCGVEWRQNPPPLATRFHVVILKLQQFPATLSECSVVPALRKVKFPQRLLLTFGLKVEVGRSRSSPRPSEMWGWKGSGSRGRPCSTKLTFGARAKQSKRETRSWNESASWEVPAWDKQLGGIQTLRSIQEWHSVHPSHLKWLFSLLLGERISLTCPQSQQSGPCLLGHQVVATSAHGTLYHQVPCHT